MKMQQSEFSICRFWVALLVGMLGAIGIWVAVPYNNYLLCGNLISDSYIPEVVVALLVLLVLVVNPLLGRVRAAWCFTRRQLALILGIWLMACVVPASGLLGMLPYSLCTVTQQANLDGTLAAVHEQMDLPPVLFPDVLELGAPTPVADGFLGRLEPGQSVPWSAWLTVLAAWGPLLLGIWLMMSGLGMIVFPQWRERERLAFPLLTVFEALIEPPAAGHRLGPVLGSKLFWSAALLVLVLHSFNGLAAATHGGFPAFPLTWNHWSLFRDGIWRSAPICLRWGKIFFSLIGVVYFMPNRISFSMWFGIFGWAVYTMVRATYFPTSTLQETDFRAGAWMAYAIAIIFLGRLHWVTVGRAMFSRRQEGEIVRDRAAGWMFTVGVVAMLCWFLWAGLSPQASIGYAIFGVLIALVVSRVVCETGLPMLMASDILPTRFISLLPLKWWSTTSIYLGGFVGVLFNYGARVNAAVMSCFSMGLDRDRPPREQPRVALILIVVLVLGVVVAGVAHLNMTYHHDIGYDGHTQIGGRGLIRMNQAVGVVKQFYVDSPFLPAPAQRWPSFIGGMIVVAGLVFACMTFPRWPLHPIALLFIRTFTGDWIWPSICMGWLIKTLITKYGGAHGYRMARPLFLGLIIGEVLAVILWTLVPLALVLLGADPTGVGRTSILMPR